MSHERSFNIFSIASSSCVRPLVCKVKESTVGMIEVYLHFNKFVPSDDTEGYSRTCLTASGFLYRLKRFTYWSDFSKTLEKETKS
ncbi:hypothetical protein ACJIZ3_017437 [Penstemon smallii]|uniref:Uncharacterized protein n=1 Tax=Penstemon smallii TaxID=265156 RepID=A0ABD3SVI2_9LAMI